MNTFGIAKTKKLWNFQILNPIPLKIHPKKHWKRQAHKRLINIQTETTSSSLIITQNKGPFLKEEIKYIYL